MADSVTSKTLFNGGRRLVMRFTNNSDSTGESNVVKVDKSTFVDVNGVEPSYFKIMKIQYSIEGMEVAISVKATSDVVLARLVRSGCLDFSKVGGLSTQATGDTGDILFSTVGHSSGDSYDITLELIKHN